MDPSSIGVCVAVGIDGVLASLSPLNRSDPKSVRRGIELVGVLDGYLSLLLEVDGDVNHSYLMTIDMASEVLFRVRGMRSFCKSDVNP